MQRPEVSPAFGGVLGRWQRLAVVAALATLIGLNVLSVNWAAIRDAAAPSMETHPLLFLFSWSSILAYVMLTIALLVALRCRFARGMWVAIVLAGCAFALQLLAIWAYDKAVVSTPRGQMLSRMFGSPLPKLYWAAVAGPLALFVILLVRSKTRRPDQRTG